MTPLDRILATFEGKKVDRIVWQPRIDHWYDANKNLGTLPRKYRGKELLEIYDDLRASPRTYRFFTPTIKVIQGKNVEMKVREDEEKIVTTYVTPTGKLREVQTRTVHGAATYPTEYLVKGVEDFRTLEYILENQEFEFDTQLYDEVSRMIGDRSEPIINLPWASIQRLTVDWMGLKNTVLSLWKHPKETSDVVQAIQDNDSRRIDFIKKTPFKFVNFADNIDQDLVSPPMFEKYMLPWYKEKTRDLHEVGKICISHWDGNIKRLLCYVKDTGIDSLECVPPLPMGNVTLEELHEAMGEMVLFDGLPANHFLDMVSEQELEDFTKQILKLFSPRIILGISDQLPPNGDIEKVRMVSEIVEQFKMRLVVGLSSFDDFHGRRTANWNASTASTNRNNTNSKP